MPVEIRMLGWAMVLGLVHLFVSAALMTRQRGVRWNAGARDGAAAPLEGMAARADRAFRNYLETFVFFAAGVLAVVATDSTSAQTAMAAQVYLWARVAYLPVYLAGIAYLRSLIWAIALWGILQLLWPLL